MAEINSEELKNLSLKERIKKLKELEEQRKKEIEEINSLLTDSEKKLKAKSIADDFAPLPTDIDISELFTSKKEDLEEAVSVINNADTKKSPATPDSKTDYMPLSQALEDYEELKGISYMSMEGELNPNHLEVLDSIGERLDNTKYVSASKEAANILVASKATLYKIRKYAGLDNINQNF